MEAKMTHWFTGKTDSIPCVTKTLSTVESDGLHNGNRSMIWLMWRWRITQVSAV